MADSDLPVFPFRPNWREGVTERLSFLTDVLTSSTGVEQRRINRQTPRRTIEADFLLSGPERAFYDLFINRLTGGEFLVPLYWELVTLRAPVVAGFTDRIEFDTSYREIRAGLYLLTGKDARVFEVVNVVGIDAGGVTLEEPATLAWRKGANLIPLRRAVADDLGAMTYPSAGVGSVTIRFLLTEPNIWNVGGAAPPTYLARDMFLAEPNWVEALPVGYERAVARMDNNTGKVYQREKISRAIHTQAHRWFLKGRQRQAAFRDLIYRYKGRAGSFWLPTFRYDLTLTKGIANVSVKEIEVENLGWRYAGGPASGRQFIAIKHDGGTIIRRVVRVKAGLTPATEIVVLDAPVGLALSTGQVRRISFADVARFDQDEFEITHHGPVDGLAECSASFREIKTNVFALVNPGFETGDTTGWSATAGGIYATTNIGAEVPHSGKYFLSCGSQFNVQFGQTLAIPSEDYQRVDTGTAILTGFSGYHNSIQNTDGSIEDHGRLMAVFYDAEMTALSINFGEFSYSYEWALVTLPDLVIPAGTRFVFLGADNVADEPTIHDNYWDSFTQPRII